MCNGFASLLGARNYRTNRKPGLFAAGILMARLKCADFCSAGNANALFCRQTHPPNRYVRFCSIPGGRTCIPREEISILTAHLRTQRRRISSVLERKIDAGAVQENERRVSCTDVTVMFFEDHQPTFCKGSCGCFRWLQLRTGRRLDSWRSTETNRFTWRILRLKQMSPITKCYGIETYETATSVPGNSLPISVNQMKNL